MDINTNYSANPSSPSQYDLIGIYFSQLRGEIVNILDKETKYIETIKQLETTLAASQAAYSDITVERKQLENQLKTLEAQLKGSRIVAIFDGHDAILSSNFITQRKEGGHNAAQIISASINEYLKANAIYQSQLWVYVFLNKSKLVEYLSKNDPATGASRHVIQSQLDSFCTGFNEASDRFCLLDIDSKHVSQAKIKALLEHEIHLPCTDKVFLGVCPNDLSYPAILQPHITAGFKRKITLISFHSEIAPGIKELELPFLHIPDLFTNAKSEVAVVTPPCSHQSSTSTPFLRPSQRTVSNSDTISDADDYSSDREEIYHDPTTKSQDYSSVLKSPTLRSASSDPLISSVRHSVTNGNYNPPQTKPMNPSIPLSKHKPPPCTLHYLASCKHGDTCRYGHDYALKPEHYEEIRINAKRSPCPAVNKGNPCFFGEQCCYGHYCPKTTKCIFFKQGRCKFTGAGMHEEMDGVEWDT